MLAVKYILSTRKAVDPVAVLRDVIGDEQATLRVLTGVDKGIF